MIDEEIIPAEIDQGTGGARETVMTDVGAGTETLVPGEMAQGIETACPEMVLPTRLENAAENIVQNEV